MTFQTITPVHFGTQAISATPTVDTVYTVPASTRALLKDVTLCNTTAAPITVRVYLVPSGGSAGTGNAILYDAPINPGVPSQWTGLSVMAAGDAIKTSASAAGVTAHFNGGEAV